MTNQKYNGSKYNSRKYNGSKRGAFKSSTSIYNYNKFLTGLDTNYQRLEQKCLEQKCLEQEKPYYNYYDKNIEQISANIANSCYKKKYNFDIINKTLNEIKCCVKNKDTVEQKIVLEEPIKPLIILEKRKVNIIYEINNINDLLKMIELYPDEQEIEYNIDMHCLHKIKEPLSQLNTMIGLKQIKENVVDQILFYIQNLHLPSDSLDSVSLKKESLDSDSLKKESLAKDFMHTVIYGPPGTGKTEIAKILGSIFAKMGVLTKGGFKKVTRSDLIAGYLGQTALKTRDVIKESLGGVLFIDEAYSLGNKDKKDSFSKECIDTLCEALSDHKDNLMVIIAGYETELNECFFDCNQGLSSRFTWRFKVDEYSATDLYNIFVKKVTEGGWTLENDNNSINSVWFEKHKSSFKFYGRDIETLFAKTKIAHSRRVFCLAPEFKRIITIADLNKGLDIYLKNESFSSNNKEKEEANKKYFSHMYM
jgi:hypothetical protein